MADELEEQILMGLKRVPPYIVLGVAMLAYALLLVGVVQNYYEIKDWKALLERNNTLEICAHLFDYKDPLGRPMDILAPNFSVPAGWSSNPGLPMDPLLPADFLRE